MGIVFLAIVLTALAAWLYLAVGRGGFWHAEWRLPCAGSVPAAAWPAVLVVVPARNEEAVLPETLRSLLALDYPGPWRVVVVDDNSTDGTAAILEAGGKAADGRLTVVRGVDLPADWTGKLWALQQAADHGLALAPETAFLWLTDADIAHPPETLSRLVAKAVNEDRALVSLMVRLDARGFWSALLVPAFVYFFQMLYPFPWVGDAGRRTAAAAGGCSLIRRSAFEAIGGFASIRGALIDDCALARAVQDRADGRLWLGLSDGSRSVRPYRRLSEVWDMVARTAFTELEHSPLRLAGTVLGMILLYIVPPLTVLLLPLHGNVAAAVAAALAWLVSAVTYGPTLADYRRPRWQALTLPLAGALYTAMTVDSALRHWRGRGGRWKGRIRAGLAEAP